MTTRSITARIAAAALIVAAAAAILYALKPLPRFNVILISIDTLRPDRMGVYGHRPMGQSTTPFLDELASGGALFTNAVSTTSWTLPAHHALFTGVPDQAHGVVNDRVPPPSGLMTLAEVLKDEGYATAGFYSGAYLDPLFGFGRGFDTYESCMPGRGARGRPPSGHGAGGDGAPRTKFAAHELVTSDRVTERAFEHIRGHSARSPGQPFFLFLHYFDVHNDYLPPPPFDKRFGPPYEGWVNGRGVTSDDRYSAGMDPADLRHLMALYDGEIGWVDENIRRLFRGIAGLDGGILDNTLVIVTSDHGEEFFEHGRAGHRKNLFEYSVRIPLIMVCPDRIPEGVAVGARARIYDIVPTVIGLLGMESPPGVLGSSLLPAVQGDAGGPRPALLDLTGIPKEGTVKRQTGFVMGGFKLVTEQLLKTAPGSPLFLGNPVIEERHALYDLDADPSEQSDLSSSRKDIVERMLAARRVLLESSEKVLRDGRAPGGRTTDIPDRLRRSLEELGYGGGGR